MEFTEDDKKLLEMLDLSDIPDQDKQVILEEIDNKMSKRFIANLLDGLSPEEAKKLETEVEALPSEDPAKIIETIIKAHPDSVKVLEETSQQVISEMKAARKPQTPSDGTAAINDLDTKPPIEEIAQKEPDLPENPNLKQDEPVQAEPELKSADLNAAEGTAKPFETTDQPSEPVETPSTPEPAAPEIAAEKPIEPPAPAADEGPIQVSFSPSAPASTPTETTEPTPSIESPAPTPEPTPAPQPEEPAPAPEAPKPTIEVIPPAAAEEPKKDLAAEPAPEPTAAPEPDSNSPWSFSGSPKTDESTPGSDANQPTTQSASAPDINSPVDQTQNSDQTSNTATETPAQTPPAPPSPPTSNPISDLYK